MSVNVSATVAEVLPFRSSQVVNIIFHTEPSRTLPKLQGLAACLGIAVERVDVAMSGSLEFAVREAISRSERGIVLDLASLENKCDEEELRAVAASFSEHDTAVLLLVSNFGEASAQIIRLLTRNAINGLTTAGQPRLASFPADSAMLSGELCSYSYPRKQDEASGLLLSSARDAQSVMMLDGTPTFVCVRLGKARIFVWVTNAVFDVFRSLAAENEFEQAADQYIPAIIFLRFAFGAQCWHNPCPGAGIIIDDPLLKKRYGFIKFPQLLNSARRHKYHITLAFIPWNYWRSRAKDAQIFREYSDCFNLCAHGCDHTNNEFRSTDYEGLLRRNFLARRRMDRHRERTGLASEALMVCPQEQYSLEAMRAFADSRQFIGLICTACMPRDLPTPQIRGADLLLPAQDSFYGFPVFKRHYANGMEAFAMALFLGKPAILVEHHEFFRDGSGGTEAFAQRLAELRPDLRWKSLAETITRTHARRSSSKTRQEVRFFTDTFYLEHELEQPMEFRLVRRLPETAQIESVRVNGRDVPYSREGGFLAFDAHVQHPQTFSVEVKITPIKPARTYSPGVKYRLSVALRRHLSEFRDNVIARNDLALWASKLVAQKLKLTGAS
jgi:hypothetical protein